MFELGFPYLLHWTQVLNLDVTLWETHPKNSIKCADCVFTCVHVHARVCEEKRRAKTNGIHPCLIRDNEGESMYLLHRTKKSKRHVNHVDMCQNRCCPYFTLYLDSFTFIILFSDYVYTEWWSGAKKLFKYSRKANKWRRRKDEKWNVLI